MYRCGHCKTLNPEWTKAALTAKESPIKLSKLDATVSPDVAQKYGVQGYPTIKFFRNGTPVDYDGGRTEKEIVSWINKKSGPPAVTITTSSDLLKLQESNDAVVIGVFTDLTAPNAVDYLTLASTTTVEVPFAITTSKDLQKELGTTTDTIVVLKKFDEKRNDYKISDYKVFDATHITSFISVATTPEVIEYSQATSKKIFGTSIKQHNLLFLDGDKDNKELLDSYAKLAKQYKG